MISICYFCLFLTLILKQCDSFLRLAKESVVHEQVEEITDLESLVAEVDDDKCFAAMSIAKTISTVRYPLSLFDGCAFLHVLDSTLQIVSSVDSSPEILAQVQEIIIPIIVFSLENRLLGTLLLFPQVSLNYMHEFRPFQ